MFSFLAHHKACTAKQWERREHIESLPPVYHAPLIPADKSILAQPAYQIVAGVQSGSLSPSDILVAYRKKALKAHSATNCLMEILIPKAEEWVKTCNSQEPLVGIPVSLKDTSSIPGYNSCIGYSAWVGKPMQKESALVHLLRDAGAMPFVKMNVLITLLSLECTNDVFGTTTNVWNKKYAPGGLTGGEGALLAYGGSCLGIGMDVVGLVCGPTHYSGIYTIKALMHRFLKMGNPTSMPGQEGIPAVYSPMTHMLEDLEMFWRAIMSMKPWTYDHIRKNCPGVQAL